MYIQWKNGTFAPVPYAGGGGLIVRRFLSPFSLPRIFEY